MFSDCLPESFHSSVKSSAIVYFKTHHACDLVTIEIPFDRAEKLAEVCSLSGDVVAEPDSWSEVIIPALEQRFLHVSV